MPLRLLLLSDLHQDDGGVPFDPASIAVPFDVAVVAGDCAGRLTNSVRWLADRFSGVPVVYVPGNHDFYRDGSANGFHVESEIADAHDLAAGTGVRLLCDGEASIGGVRFLGGTLWSDLRATIDACGSVSAGLGRARRGMNDYRFIHRTSTTRGSRRIKPEDTLSWHRAAKRFLEDALSAPSTSPTVVVTHHAPSLRSLADPQDDLDGCYASNLEADIARWSPDLWVHGHIHSFSDYTVGGTRIVCNPLGRAYERTGFRRAFTIDPESGRRGM